MGQNDTEAAKPLDRGQKATRAALFAVCFIMRILPLAFHEPIANAIGKLLYSRLKRQRKTVLGHLEIAFGNRYTPEELNAIALRTNQNMVKNAFEFTRFPAMSKERLLSIVTFEGEENIQAALKKNKGVIVVSAHFGNWELLGALLVARGYELTVVRRDQDDGVMNDFILSQRDRTGIKTVPRDKPLFKTLMGLLKANELVALISDQNAGYDGLFVDFFGRAASTFRGPGLFAAISGAAVVPIFIVREGYLKHRVIFYPEIVIQPSGDIGKDILATTALVTKSIETAVDKYPDHWMWFHRRWKIPPPGSD